MSRTSIPRGISTELTQQLARGMAAEFRALASSHENLMRSLALAGLLDKAESHREKARLLRVAAEAVLVAGGVEQGELEMGMKGKARHE